MRIRVEWLALIASIAWLLFAVASHAAVTHPVRDLAARVVPRGTTVRCIAMHNGDEGRTYEREDGTFLPLLDLSRETCAGLARLSAHRIRSWDASANSLETLLHEAHHLSLRSSDESRVECAALASLPYWLKRLGYTGTRLARLDRLAWVEHYKLPAQYQGCSPRLVRPQAKP